jgi:hypothetical protein
MPFNVTKKIEKTAKEEQEVETINGRGAEKVY